MEHDQLASDLSTGVPIEPSFIAPGAFGAQVRATQVRRIVIVQVRIAGDTKRAADAPTQFETPREPDAAADARAELAGNRTVDLLPRADREGEAAQRADIQ